MRFQTLLLNFKIHSLNKSVLGPNDAFLLWLVPNLLVPPAPAITFCSCNIDQARLLSFFPAEVPILPDSREDIMCRNQAASRTMWTTVFASNPHSRTSFSSMLYCKLTWPWQTSSVFVQWPKHWSKPVESNKIHNKIVIKKSSLLDLLLSLSLICLMHFETLKELQSVMLWVCLKMRKLWW